jgi:hypothetical protein
VEAFTEVAARGQYDRFRDDGGILRRTSRSGGRTAQQGAAFSLLRRAANGRWG